MYCNRVAWVELVALGVERTLVLAGDSFAFVSFENSNEDTVQVFLLFTE